MKDIKERESKVYIAEGARVIGDVTIGDYSGIWYNAVVRGDEEAIRIGERTNIQDNCTLHADHGYPVEIGDGATIGHACIIHGCSIGDNSLIGMGSIVLNGAKIGNNCLIGAGSLVTGGTVIPDGWMAFGSPAKPVRPLKEEEIAGNEASAKSYMHIFEKHE